MKYTRRILIALAAMNVLMAVAWADTAWRGVPTVQTTQGLTADDVKERYPESKYHQSSGSSPWPFVVKVATYHSEGLGGEGEIVTFAWCFGLIREVDRVSVGMF